MIVICDNSALSRLAEIGELDLLRRLYGKIHVTGTVRQETIHSGEPEGLRSLFLSQPDWISVVQDDSPFLEETGSLDAGEASSITLAWQHRGSCLLILDERRGRKVADALGLRITRTAGLLTGAAASRFVDFDDVFTRLERTGFRLSRQIVETLRQSLEHGRRPAGE